LSDRGSTALAALVAEAAVGYPPPLVEAIGHPVVWIGRVIDRLDGDWNRGSPRRRRAAGAGAVAVTVALAAGTGWLIERAAGRGSGRLGIVVAATTGLAQRSLDEHIGAVRAPLARGDLHTARGAVANVVGRDTAELDDRGVALAAIESLAESFCDGVVAPAFWLRVGGLPGLFAYKAVNTADSMIGHRDARYADFGWAAARIDDVLNLLPARLAGVLVCLAGAGGVATMLRDAGAHASPNGGWPEAAMAGVLGRQLGGPVAYDGEPAWRATLGDGPLPDAADLARAIGVYRRACLLLWLVTGIAQWRR